MSLRALRSFSLERGALARLVLEFCKKGSPLSKVDKVEADWVKSEESFENFEIL